MSLNRVIGNQNRIPWHLPEDFKWFKEMTTGHVLIMGRKTFESIGRPLPNRETIVLSKSGFSHAGVRTVASLANLRIGSDTRRYFICGGALVYAQALPLCSDVYLTLVKREVEGDTFMPPFEAKFELKEVIKETHDFRIQHFQAREA